MSARDSYLKAPVEEMTGDEEAATHQRSSSLNEDDNKPLSANLAPYYDPIFMKKFVAMAIGNLMEWFDFSTFGALADVMGSNFFPTTGSHMLQLLQAMGVFGAAFLMRPLGGIVIGWIGDTIGRKRALEASIALMLLPSFLIGCLPTYDTIGWWAPLLLVLLRLMQGIAAGGELVGAFLYTLEATGGNSMGYWGGACKASGNFGTALGMGVVTLLRAILSEDDLYDWGWRIPFWLGLLIGLCGIMARRNLTDDAAREGIEFEHAQEANRQTVLSSEEAADGTTVITSHQVSPLQKVFLDYKLEIVIIILTTAMWGVTYYTIFVWMAYFLAEPSMIGGSGVENGWESTFAANILLVLMLPIGGLVGDYFHRADTTPLRAFAKAKCIGVIGVAVLILPAFALIITRQEALVVLGQCLLVFPVAIYGANMPAFMISLFAAPVRYTGVGIAYNAGGALFSSTTSLVQSSLVLSSLFNNHKGSSLDDARNGTETIWLADARFRPAYYIIFIALFAIIGLTKGVDRVEKRANERRIREEHILEQARIQKNKIITVNSSMSEPINKDIEMTTLNPMQA